MEEIKGKVNTAISYAHVIEDSAREQIQRMCDYDLAEGSRIRIMPDVHAGAGCTIGTTMTITDKICANLVGVDIGCGMYTVNLGHIDIDFQKLDKAVHTVPSGFDVWEGRQEHFDLMGLNCYRSLKNTRRLERSLGTLGGGNHFIEMDKAADDSYYLIIHSGSRNLGKQVAEYYQHLAIELHQGKEKYLKAREELIREYKAQGRRSEIQDALSELTWQKHQSDIPDDLAYLTGNYMNQYMQDIVICQQFARRSREFMAEVIMDKMDWKSDDKFHTIHNYINTKEMILRKGAIAAHKGERVLIPINMRDGSILAIGKGNPEWNYSAPHGAGRIMSRAKARENLDIEAYKNSMKDVYTTSVNANTIDEAPMAYKSLHDILDFIGDTVEIVDVMKPVYNFKASD